MIEQLKLETDETMMRLVRKHWFILVAKTIGIVLCAVMPPILAFGGLLSAEMLPTIMINPSDFYSPAGFFSAAWLLIMWMVLFGFWTDYYLDCWIITNKRVIAIDQQGFFRRKVASFRLERLQNVTIDIHGIIATILNFGHITAETAGNTEAFRIYGIPDPRGIKALIQEHADKLVPTPRASTDQL